MPTSDRDCTVQRHSHLPTALVFSSCPQSRLWPSFSLSTGGFRSLLCGNKCWQYSIRGKKLAESNLILGLDLTFHAAATVRDCLNALWKKCVLSLLFFSLQDRWKGSVSFILFFFFLLLGVYAFLWLLHFEMFIFPQPHTFFNLFLPSLLFCRFGLSPRWHCRQLMLCGHQTSYILGSVSA